MKTIRIKYFEGAKKLEKISKGDWIDLRANKDIFIPKGEMRLIPLGVAMELPIGYEAHLVPRSSTFKKRGIIQTNHCGIIDCSYCGDNDEWLFPAYCLEDRDECEMVYKDGVGTKKYGTWIRKGDRICQFIILPFPKIEAEYVEDDENFRQGDRGGGIGSTGV